MKTASGLNHDGITIGTHNKYESRNPLLRLRLNRFFRLLDEFVAATDASTIHEIGCGEGFITLRLKKQGYNICGSDFSDKVIEIAKYNALAQGVSPCIFKTRNIYNLTLEDAADTLVCCEVLEHLENPSEALNVLKALSPKFVIFSVPSEPLWRILNFTRGKYLSAWGNSPGHIQHWSRIEFINLLRPFFTIEEVRTPLPWTMVLCSSKNAGE